MHIILTGATGLVGTAVLHHILSLPATSPITQQISRVSIITRRAIPLLQHPDRPKANNVRIDVLEHSNFKDYSSILDKLRGDEKIGVVWALGVSQNLAASEEHYDEITRQFALEGAKAISSCAKDVNFVYVSGEGANPKPGMFTPLFGRVKGRLETELLTLAKTEPYTNLKVYNARPGGVDPGAEKEQALVDEVSHATDGGTGGKTRNALTFKAMEKAFLPVLRAGVYKGMHSPTGELSRVLLELAMGDGEPITVKGVEADGRTLPCIALRRVAGAIQ